MQHISDQEFGMILFINFTLFINFELTNLVRKKLFLHGFYKSRTIKTALQDLIDVFTLTKKYLKRQNELGNIRSCF